MTSTRVRASRIPLAEPRRGCPVTEREYFPGPDMKPTTQSRIRSIPPAGAFPHFQLTSFTLRKKKKKSIYPTQSDPARKERTSKEKAQKKVTMMANAVSVLAPIDWCHGQQARVKRERERRKKRAQWYHNPGFQLVERLSSQTYGGIAKLSFKSSWVDTAGEGEAGPDGGLVSLVDSVKDPYGFIGGSARVSFPCTLQMSTV
ncbi:hypothetical protein PDE_09788 [Penicillium oxalicum 114-2]|uniref:Uncharacterized protein n=1 Tax=Penicillium oxalicum (strain 114-2 / CGMCC 5302) TaxID=933388 RepID=S7ZWL5_PENO1|nr:hypothetical protein PDE_09788 [Penicillium oxalicum 114-2]